MHRSNNARRLLGALGLSAVLTATLLAPPAQATTAPADLSASVTKGVGYLKTLQAADGSFVTAGLSDEWAFSALAAAGTAAADVTPNGDTSKNARAVYRTQVAQSSWPNSAPVVTDYERGLLNTYAAGIDPARVSASRNLVADVFSFWQPSAPGYFGTPGNFNGTVFALLALAGARTQGGAVRVPRGVLAAAVSVVRANEHNDGGWDFTQAEGKPSTKAATSDIDMTGAALAALCSSGVANTDSAVVAGKNFLTSKLVSSTGAFDAAFGPNADSNGWAVSGLNACGFSAQSGAFVTPAGKTPVDFLVGLQVRSTGGFRYQTGTGNAAAYASIDAVRALAGGGFTATPPTPVTSGESRWASSTKFSAGTAATLALTVDTGSSVQAGSVSLTPSANTSTLGTLLDAAAGHATPSGLVSSSAPSGASGQITAINGTANGGGRTWKVSIDGSTAVSADRGTVIRLGDTVGLTYG